MSASLAADELPRNVPARLRRLRTALGLTQTELAARLGVSFASVNRWERGHTSPASLAWQSILRLERTEPPSGNLVVSADGDNPPLDFAGNPALVRLVAEGERLASGYQVNAAFASELSLIEPLPHQRLAVYECMLGQPRLRFLLADDAGAGKTIMSGLYLRETLARRLLSRVLIVPPAGLVGNWERELRTLFGLPFRIVGGSEARDSNPFVGEDSDLLIVSVDTLTGERLFARLQDPAVRPYDLVIFDEAHKLAANREPDFTITKTGRYRLAEALAGLPGDDSKRDWSLGWAATHLLLLSATPHMGKDFPYYALWRLLEPEALATLDAFRAYPAEARARHFIRRSKEELVRYDGSPIYPTRVSDTLSYDLNPGEQRLYDETTAYMRVYYNTARILNRSAARLAMSVFQRRLASSTYALLRSFERRLAKLDGLIADLRSGRLTLDALATRQQRLKVRDVLGEETADEEQAAGGLEENEAAEETALEAVALSLEQLQQEREQVAALLALASSISSIGDESKFLRLREVLRDPRFRDEKLIIFTEHRDTLDFLVGRLEGLGFAGRIARLHGAMEYAEREEQIRFFRTPAGEGGATYLVATDAAGEGINLQFCWLMVNYDVPWNPARLEQRMGRIHRYGQAHDPVVIINLVAGKTREGRVLKTLLEKLERIRQELGSDKVYDVIGQLFEGVSLLDYLDQATSDEEAERALTGALSTEQVVALRARERRLYGDGGDVQRELPRLRDTLEMETYRRLLPGYVRAFVERAAPALDLAIDGDLDGSFTLRAVRPHALDPLLPALERYTPEQQQALTVAKPADAERSIFLRPGEPLFERLRAWVAARFAEQAQRGAIFVDATADRPYLFHLAAIAAHRTADPALVGLGCEETLAYHLVGLRQEETGEVSECPVETLLLLQGATAMPDDEVGLARVAEGLLPAARAFALERVARPLADELRVERLVSLPEREGLLARGYDYQEAELAEARARVTEKARQGDHHAKAQQTRLRERQRGLGAQREAALATLRREPELIVPGDVDFLAHALVVPSADPADAQRQEAEAEALAVRVVRAYEEARGATVRDVSKPAGALAAGLPPHPGFDLLSRYGEEERDIEVKGRAGKTDVEVTANEWAQACNRGQRYWLYAVYDCASLHPRLVRVQDPFRKLLAHVKGNLVIAAREVLAQGDVADGGS